VLNFTGSPIHPPLYVLSENSFDFVPRVGLLFLKVTLGT
jgi:hypothetical protein